MIHRYITLCKSFCYFARKKYSYDKKDVIKNLLHKTIRCVCVCAYFGQCDYFSFGAGNVRGLAYGIHIPEYFTQKIGNIANLLCEVPRALWYVICDMWHTIFKIITDHRRWWFWSALSILPTRTLQLPLWRHYAGLLHVTRPHIFVSKKLSAN